MSIKNKGYSLIELVVAITIGGIVLSTVMGSFLMLSQTKQKLDITRQIQRELNFATIRIADRIRAQSIDYTRIDIHNNHFLPVGLEDMFHFKPNEGQLYMNDAPLFSPNVVVKEVIFKVEPELQNKRLQPRVRMELLVSSRDNQAIFVPLRTTISSRLIQ